MNMDPQNLDYMKYAVVAENLDTAMNFAARTAKTENLLIFDGAVGGMNISEPLAETADQQGPGCK